MWEGRWAAYDAWAFFPPLEIKEICYVMSLGLTQLLMLELFSSSTKKKKVGYL